MENTVKVAEREFLFDFAIYDAWGRSLRTRTAVPAWEVRKWFAHFARWDGQRLVFPPDKSFSVWRSGDIKELDAWDFMPEVGEDSEE